MATRHSFSSEIKNIHGFEAEIKNTQSFQSEILNIHTFGEVPTVADIILTEQFWFSRIISRFFMAVNNISATLNLDIEFDIPKIATQIDSTLITMRQTISSGIDIAINAPVISAIFNFFESINVNMSIPIEMSAIITDEQHLTSDISIPKISLDMTMITIEYYITNIYDSYLLSDLDGNLLSEMDAILV